MFNEAKKICEILNKNGFKAFFVGGCVRDTFMHTEPHDIDITTDAKPEDIQKIFTDHIDTGLKHGTVSVRMIPHGEFFEVTTFRIDGKYEDGRHPDEVIFVTDVKDDLARRDFTINAIAFDPITNSYTDPFNGKDDINAKIIRAVGNAKNRFMEDPLRVLRAMRFAIKLGFTIDSDTAVAMHDTEVLDKLANCISKERITEELRKMLTCSSHIRDIFIKFSDIIAIIIPEIKPCINAPHNSIWHPHDIYDHILHVVDNCNTAKFEIKLAALLHDIGKPSSRIHDNEHNCDHFYGHPAISEEIAAQVFDKDLRVSKDEETLIRHLILEHDREINPTFKSIRRFISNYSLDFVYDWIIIKDADIKDHSAPEGFEAKFNDTLYRFMLFQHNLNTVVQEDSAFTVKDLKINGNDVMTILNIKPGPIIGKILEELLDDIIEERIDNNKDELINVITSRYIPECTRINQN